MSAASWLIRFRVADAEAALPLGIVREVTTRPRLARVPGSHAFVTGIALHRGMALPVYDLARFEPLWAATRPRPSAPPDAEHVIVCDWGEARLGLLGDQVDVLPAGPLEREPDPERARRCGLSPDYVSEILHRDGGAVLLLDPGRLFASLGVPAAEPRSAGEGGGEDDPARR